MKVKESNSSNIEYPDSGLYEGYITKVIEIGTVTDNFKGEDKIVNKIYIGCNINYQFNINTPEGEKTKYFDCGMTFTNSKYKQSNLVKILKNIGIDLTTEKYSNYDLKDLIGMPVMVNVEKVEKEDKRYVKFISFSKLPPQVKVEDIPNMESEYVYFDYENHSDDFTDKMKMLPPYIQKEAERSVEYKEKVIGNNNKSF